MPAGITLFIYGYTALIVLVLIIIANIVMNTHNMATDLKLSINHRIVITIVTIFVYYHLVNTLPLILIDFFFYNGFSIQSIIEMKVFIAGVVGLITYNLTQLLLLHFFDKRNADVSVIISTLVVAISLVGISNLESISDYVSNTKSQIAEHSENLQQLAQVIGTPGYKLPDWTILDTYESDTDDYIFKVLFRDINAEDLTFYLGIKNKNCEIATTLDYTIINIAYYRFSKNDLESCPYFQAGENMYIKFPQSSKE